MEEMLKQILGEMKEVNHRLDNIEGRFNSVEVRHDNLEKRFDSVEARHDHLEERFDRVESRHDHLEKRFDNVENRLHSLEKGQETLQLGQDQLKDNLFNDLAPYFEQIEKHFDAKTDELKDNIEGQQSVIDTLAARSIKHESEIKDFKRIQEM